MKIFISWSGEPSQTFARALAEWLPMVIQSVKPFMSTYDIRSGQRWPNEIGKQLEENTFGIICLTPNNRDAPWIHFEAGALSKFVDESAVVPLRIGIENAEITAPLSQFQAKDLTKDDMRALVLDINSRMDSGLDPTMLGKVFEKFWPDLESSIKVAQEAVKHSGLPAAKRSSGEMAAETLNTVRSLARNVEDIKMHLMSTQLAQSGSTNLGDLLRSKLGNESAVRKMAYLGARAGIPARTVLSTAAVDLGLGAVDTKKQGK